MAALFQVSFSVLMENGAGRKAKQSLSAQKCNSPKEKDHLWDLKHKKPFKPCNEFLSIGYKDQGTARDMPSLPHSSLGRGGYGCVK